MPKVTKCKHILKDRSSGKMRRCKKMVSNTFCYIHAHIHDDTDDKHTHDDNNNKGMNEVVLDFGKCCYCDGACNPLSQACGICVRIMSWWGPKALASKLNKSIDEIV